MNHNNNIMVTKRLVGSLRFAWLGLAWLGGSAVGTGTDGGRKERTGPSTFGFGRSVGVRGYILAARRSSATAAA